MTAHTLKNPGSCRQCGGTGIVVAADGANFDPCAVCQPAGGVYVVKGWKAPGVPACAAMAARLVARGRFAVDPSPLPCL